MRKLGPLVGACAIWSACSTASPARPVALGDCVPRHDAACAVPLVGGGAASDVGAAAATEGGSPGVADGGSCGVGAQLLSAASGSCVPCVADACCLADQACSSQPACLFLVECARACQQGDTVCFGNCENQQPLGITGYNDFARCLLASCSPSCPTLPQ